MSVTGFALVVNAFIDGWDFQSLPDLVNDLSPEEACVVPPNSPHSVASSVWHICFWLERWQNAIAGVKQAPITHPIDDFKAMEPAEWPALKERMHGLLKKLSDMKKLSEEELTRELRPDITVYRYGVVMVVHSSYHAGQIGLIRQLIGKWPPASQPEDAWPS